MVTGGTRSGAAESKRSWPSRFVEMKPWWLAMLVAGIACTRPLAPEALVRLEVAGDRLTLHPTAGARINAKVKPTLELAEGPLVFFDQGAVDADTSYFTEPPRADFRSTGMALRGTLRVGVCPAGMSVCRSLTIPISAPLAAP